MPSSLSLRFDDIVPAIRDVCCWTPWEYNIIRHVVHLDEKRLCRDIWSSRPDIAAVSLIILCGYGICFTPTRAYLNMYAEMATAHSLLRGYTTFKGPCTTFTIKGFRAAQDPSNWNLRVRRHTYLIDNVINHSLMPQNSLRCSSSLRKRCILELEILKHIVPLGPIDWSSICKYIWHESLQ